MITREYDPEWKSIGIQARGTLTSKDLMTVRPHSQEDLICVFIQDDGSFRVDIPMDDAIKVADAIYAMADRESPKTNDDAWIKELR